MGAVPQLMGAVPQLMGAVPQLMGAVPQLMGAVYLATLVTNTQFVSTHYLTLMTQYNPRLLREVGDCGHESKVQLMLVQSSDALKFACLYVRSNSY
jgi:hypothetical protein